MDSGMIIFYVATCIILPLFALIFLLVGIVERRKGKRLGAFRRELELRGVTTTGQVERLRPVNPYKDKKSPNDGYMVTFNYTYQDKSHSGYAGVRLSQIYQMDLEAGSPLTIRHLPEDPEQAVVLAFNEDVKARASARSAFAGVIMFLLLDGLYWVWFMISKH